MSEEAIYEVLETLCGPNMGVADSWEDKKREENLEKFISIHRAMTNRIEEISIECHESIYGSKARIGKMAHDYIEQL